MQHWGELSDTIWEPYQLDIIENHYQLPPSPHDAKLHITERQHDLFNDEF
jgi:hypothetical protein